MMGGGGGIFQLLMGSRIKTYDSDSPFDTGVQDGMGHSSVPVGNFMVCDVQLKSAPLSNFTSSFYSSYRM